MEIIMKMFKKVIRKLNNKYSLNEDIIIKINADDIKKYYDKNFFIIPNYTILEYERNFWTIYKKGELNYEQLTYECINNFIQRDIKFVATNKQHLIELI